LYGRFLHITDLHPDDHYQPGAGISSSCHRPAKKRDLDDQRPENTKNGIAGPLGAQFSDCDSPWILINGTLNWLKQEVQERGIDFIVWTGDSARHEDKKLPRTIDEVVDSNTRLINAVRTAFPSIPIVPSLGNNDVHPKDKLGNGPNPMLTRLLDAWKTVIPPEELQSFQDGGYFANEVIPGRMAVVSMNTLYFFTSNSNVDGCRTPEDPGSQQLVWLAKRLHEYHERGLAVLIIGHVAASPKFYYRRCQRAYVDLLLKYADTVRVQLFGHQNMDYFMFADGGGSGTTEQQRPSRGDYLGWLVEQYERVGATAEDQGRQAPVALVSPSVIPDAHPGVRIYTY
ncbi:Metallo-dependent phosphatase-like protein, partial [Thamnocephalis sphaerospora]